MCHKGVCLLLGCWFQLADFRCRIPQVEVSGLRIFRDLVVWNSAVYVRLKLHRRLVCLARSAKARGLWVQGLCCPFRLQKFSFLGDRARGCIPLLLWCSRCWNVRASVCRTSLAHNLKLFSFADSYKISHPLRTCCCILGSLSTLQVHCASPVPFPGNDSRGACVSLWMCVCLRSEVHVHEVVVGFWGLRWSQS